MLGSPFLSSISNETWEEGTKLCLIIISKMLPDGENIHQAVSLAIGPLMCMGLRQCWESRGYHVPSPKIKWIYTRKEAGPKFHFTQCLFIVNNVNSSWCFGTSSFGSTVSPSYESCISCPHRHFVCFYAFLKAIWLSHGHEPLLGKLK